MSRLRRTLNRINEHWLLGTMLALLHVAIWWDFASPLSRSLMLAHLGVFLIWQPLWQRERPMRPGSTLLFVVATLSIVYWLNWWIIFVWLVVLVGLIGGRAFVDRGERYGSLIALTIVICELLIGVVTPMFGIAMDPAILLMCRYGLLALALALFIVPLNRTDGGPAGTVDPVHGINIALLTTILALSSLLIMYSTGIQYPIALVQAMFGIAAFLFVISWLSSPQLGFGGLGYVWTRYLLNIGTPFEDWLDRLSQLSRAESSPKAFLDLAMTQLQELGWISGVHWESPVGQGKLGTETAHMTRIRSQGLEVSAYTPRVASTTLLLHGTLLVRII